MSNPRDSAVAKKSKRGPPNRPLLVHPSRISLMFGLDSSDILITEKVVCIARSRQNDPRPPLQGLGLAEQYLTIGKVYESTRYKPDLVPFHDTRICVVKNDVGDIGQYHSDLFITLSEIRAKKLDELGI